MIYMIMTSNLVDRLGRRNQYLNCTFFRSQAIINVQNEDQQCLKWALLSALHPTNRNSSKRVSQYARYANELDFSGEDRFHSCLKSRVFVILVYPTMTNCS